MASVKRPDRLIVDANRVFSVLLGEPARQVFFEGDIGEFAVPARVIDEVRRNVPQLGQRLDLEPTPWSTR